MEIKIYFALNPCASFFLQLDQSYNHGTIMKPTLSWSVYLTLKAKGGKTLVTNRYQICQLLSPRVAGQSKPLPACEQLLGTTVWSWVSGRSQSGRTTPEFPQHSYCLNTPVIFIRKKCPRYLKYCSTRKSFLSTYTSPFRKSPMGFFNPAIPN